MEVRKDIIGYETQYQVSNVGNVRSLDRISYNGKGLIKLKGRMKKPSLNRYGYLRVRLWSKSKGSCIYIHRLVAQAFLGLDISNRDIKVCHKNDIRNDNRLENLELGTQEYNMIDCSSKGNMFNQKEKSMIKSILYKKYLKGDIKI